MVTTGSILFKYYALFQLVCSYIFFPIAICVGIPSVDALAIGSIYGKKIMMSEFLSYIELGGKSEEGLLQVTFHVLLYFLFKMIMDDFEFCIISCF